MTSVTKSSTPPKFVSKEKHKKIEYVNEKKEFTIQDYPFFETCIGSDDVVHCECKACVKKFFNK